MLVAVRRPSLGLSCDKRGTTLLDFEGPLVMGIQGVQAKVEASKVGLGVEIRPLVPSPTPSTPSPLLYHPLSLSLTSPTSSLPIDPVFRSFTFHPLLVHVQEGPTLFCSVVGSVAVVVAPFRGLGLRLRWRLGYSTNFSLSSFPWASPCPFPCTYSRLAPLLSS